LRHAQNVKALFFSPSRNRASALRRRVDRGLWPR
jgi:hypothetical protein